MILSAAAAIPATPTISISPLIPSPLLNGKPTVVTANGWPSAPFWFIVVPGLTGDILEYSDVKVVAWQDRVLNALAEIETKIQSDGGDSDPFQPQTVTWGVVTAKFDAPDSPYPVPPLKPFNRQMARLWIHQLRTLTWSYGPKAISSADILIDNLPAIRFSLVIARSIGVETSKREIQSNASALAIPYTNATSNGDAPWPPIPFYSKFSGHPTVSLTILGYGQFIPIIDKSDILDALASMEEGIRVEGKGIEPFTQRTVAIGILAAFFDAPNPPAMRRFTRTQAALVIAHVRALFYTFGPKEIEMAEIRIDGSLRALFSSKVGIEVQDGQTMKRSLPSKVSMAMPHSNMTTSTGKEWPSVPFHVDIESPLSMTFIEYDNTAIANQPLALTSIFEIGTIVKRSGFHPSDPIHTREFTAGNVVISFIDIGFASPQKCTRRQAVKVVAAVYALSCDYGPKRIASAYIMIEGVTVLEFRLEVKDGIRGIEIS